MHLARPLVIRRSFVVVGLLAVAYLVHLSSMRNFVDLVIGTAWPIAGLIVVLIFRKELIKLVGRVRRIGKDGAEFEQPQRALMDDLALPAAGGPPLTTVNTAAARTLASVQQG